MAAANTTVEFSKLHFMYGEAKSRGRHKETDFLCRC